MRPPASELTLAIKRFPLKGWLEAHAFEELQEGEWSGWCPKCAKEQKVVVNMAKRAWHCWFCQRKELKTRHGVTKMRVVEGGGGILRLLMWIDGMSMAEAIRAVLQAAHHDPAAIDAIPNLEFLVDVLEDVPAPKPAPVPEFWQPITGILPYCAKRGITPADVQTFGLFWCAQGRYQNRLFFPAWEGGELVYWQARAMWEESDRPGERFVKSLNPIREDGMLGSGDVVMNLEQAATFPRVALVEGPIDCVHAGPSGAATYGKRISMSQLARLIRAGVQGIDLMWDGPSEREPVGAWPEMMRAAELLSLYFDVRLVALPHGDPGDFPREVLDVFRARGVPAAALSPLARL
jgi:hypothetical protein